MSTKENITIKDIRKSPVLLEENIHEFYKLVSGLRHDTREIPESLSPYDGVDEIEAFLIKFHNEYATTYFNDTNRPDYAIKRANTEEYLGNLLEAWTKMVEELSNCDIMKEDSPCCTVLYNGKNVPIVLTDYIKTKEIKMRNAKSRKRQLCGLREHLSRLSKLGYDITQSYEELLRDTEYYTEAVAPENQNLKNVLECGDESLQININIESNYGGFIEALENYLEVFDNIDEDSCS